jgi:hypothetical protein
MEPAMSLFATLLIVLCRLALTEPATPPSACVMELSGAKGPPAGCDLGRPVP